MEPILINILFFGALKQYFGNTHQLAVNKGDNLVDVLQKLKMINALGFEILESCQLAVNSAIVERDFVISQECELALLPPFSGG